MPHIYNECRTYITHPAHVTFLAACITFKAAHITFRRTYIILSRTYKTFRRTYITFRRTYILLGRTYITLDFIFSFEINTYKAVDIDLECNLFAQKCDF